MIEDRSPSLFKQHRSTHQLINRCNVKFFIRCLLGLALAHIIGQQFRTSHATVSSHRKSHGKSRIQKTTINDSTPIELTMSYYTC
jgi:hypothetical protein